MIEAFKKIWQFAGEERKNINKSVAVSFLSAVLQMFQVGAIYLVVLALTNGAQGAKTAWLALIFELISIFGGAILSSFSKMYQTHAGYFMAADRRIAIADRMKRVPMGFFNDNSTGQLSGVCTTVVSTIENMVPMVLVNILGGLMGAIPAAFGSLTPSFQPFDLCVGVICGVGLRLAVYLKGKNAKKYRHNQEYGSARWSA